MRRELDRLQASKFDLLVIGGGVYGAALAREAACRGATVALLEQGDFAGATSSNSLKILHGGFRYLQQADFPRMRRSIAARREWSVIAPSLVKPLPCAIASRGIGTRSAPALAGALAVNDLVSADRNQGVASSARIPRGRLLSRRAFREIAGPAIGKVGSPGGLWWDVLALDTEALVMGLIAQAAERGACVVNYVAATAIIEQQGRVEGVTARDLEAGGDLEVRARRVICATGMEPHSLVRASSGGDLQRCACWGVNVLLNRKWHTDTALTLSEPAGQRQLFFVPWRGRTLVGTHYVADDGRGSASVLRRRAALELLEMASGAAPGLGLLESDIALVHWGRLPLSERPSPERKLRLATSPLLLDYGRCGGPSGLWSLIGVKYTTALEEARRAVPQVLHGLVIRSMEPRVGRFGMLAPLSGPAGPVSDESAGESAARDWQARKLEDAVFRRTGCGSAGYPGRDALKACARGMARALGWGADRIGTEIDETMALYRERHFWKGQE